MARGFVSALVVITRGKVQPASKRRLSKSFRSAERPPHRARGVRYKKRAHDPVPHRSARGANSSFKEASAHREAAQESNRGCRFGIAAARRGAHERGLTTRCSGLATLAAELDIVRPRILKTALVPVAACIFVRARHHHRVAAALHRSFHASRNSSSAFRVSAPLVACGIWNSVHLVRRALSVGPEGRSIGPVLVLPSAPHITCFRERLCIRNRGMAPARGRQSRIVSAHRSGPSTGSAGSNNALQRTRCARR